jgi:hypothetical protein
MEEIETQNEIDWTGAVMGRLRVLRRDRDHFRCGCRMWRCECSCGNVTSIYEHELAMGTRPSCGCQNQLKNPLPPLRSTTTDWEGERVA